MLTVHLLAMSIMENVINTIMMSLTLPIGIREKLVVLVVIEKLVNVIKDVVHVQIGQILELGVTVNMI